VTFQNVSERAIRALPPWRFASVTPSDIMVVVWLGLALAIGWAVAQEEWQLLIFIALAALLPLALRWPVVVAFGVYAFLVPFDSVTLFTVAGGATITKMLGIMAAGVLLLVGVVQKRLVRPPRAALWIALLLLWGTMTLGWAVNLETAQSRVLTAVSLIGMYLVAVSFRVSKRELTTVCILMMLGGALAATAGVVVGFEDITARADRGLRGTLAVAGSDRANPNNAAQSFLLPLSIAIAMFLASRRLWAKALGVAAIGSITAAIFLTMSRASLAALLVMMCVFLYRFRARLQVLAVVAIVAALLPLMPNLFFDRIVNVFTGEDATGAGRTHIWSAAVDALQRFGWFGAGLSNFPHAYDIFVPGGFSKGAHNTFLGTWVELGVIGLALLVAAFVAHLRTGARTQASMHETAFPVAIQAACFGITVIAFFGDVLWFKTLWMPWILIVWASRINASNSES
jgi:hypothetical protein